MKFKAGDQVVVYGREWGAKMQGFKAKVESINEDGMLFVNTKDTAYYVHPKQCRRLVKKPRRRIWVNFYPTGTCVHLSKEEADKHAGRSRIECVEFIECKKK